jgi:hypothetical protein
MRHACCVDDEDSKQGPHHRVGGSRCELGGAYWLTAIALPHAQRRHHNIKDYTIVAFNVNNSRAFEMMKKGSAHGTL